MTRRPLSWWARAAGSAIGLPVLAAVVYRVLYPELHPFIWFLFYPAIFAAAWFGGVIVGLLATAMSTVLAVGILAPMEPDLPQGAVELFPAAIFALVGTALTVFHARVRAGNVRLAEAVAQRKRFAALVENSSDFIGIADPAGRLLYVNPAGRQMVGLAADVDVQSTKILDFYAPSERELADEVILTAMIELGRWRGETYIRHWETGAAIPVSDTQFLIRDPATGEILGMGTMKRDISDRKRLERKLAAATSDLVRAQTVAEVGSWRLDANRELVWSDETYRIFGVPLGTPLSYDLFLSCVHPEDRAEVDRQWQAALQGAPYDTEMRVVAGGDVRWIHAKAEIHSDNGATTAIGIAHDITARRRLEHDLRLLVDASVLLGETLDYDATLTNLAQLVVRELADFCVIDVMRGDLQRIKAASRDPAKAGICDALMRVRIERRPLLLQESLDTARPVVLTDLGPDELARYAQDEEHLAALRALDAKSIVSVPMITRDGMLGAIGFVSSSHVYGEADVATATDLARRAALSIDHSLLYETAMRAIRSRDDVLSVVAHDLRNPLNTIRLQSELLRIRGGEAERDRAISIDRAAVRMDRLIEDLLDVTRLEGGAIVLDRSFIKPRALLSEVIEAQRPSAAIASLALQLDVPETLPEVYADRNRVLQICENLVGNATKFTPAGGRISIGALARDHEVMFWVADTGEGMDEEQLPHVFDRFWQAHESHRRRGAGLGLPIVKGLVEAHGGRVWVESARNRGTTFFFTLPTRRPREEAIAAPA